jgi:hypothetical protein
VRRTHVNAANRTSWTATRYIASTHASSGLALHAGGRCTHES